VYVCAFVVKKIWSTEMEETRIKKGKYVIFNLFYINFYSAGLSVNDY
jgi:hypothetical protein